MTTKIDAKKRTKEAKGLELKPCSWRDDLRMLTPLELTEIRASLMRVQGAGDSFSGLRAMRLIALLDWYEGAWDERKELEAVIDGGGDLTLRIEDFTEATDDLLKKDHAANLADLFEDEGEPSKLCKAVSAYVTKELEAARTAIADQVKILTEAVAEHVKALEDLSDDEEG